MLERPLYDLVLDLETIKDLLPCLFDLELLFQDDFSPSSSAHKLSQMRFIEKSGALQDFVEKRHDNGVGLRRLNIVSTMLSGFTMPAWLTTSVSEVNMGESWWDELDDRFTGMSPGYDGRVGLTSGP